LKTFTVFIPNSPFSRILLITSFFVFAAAFVPVVGLVFLIFLPLLTLFYSVAAGKAKTTIAFLIPVLPVFLISHLWQLNAPYLMILTMGVAGLAGAAIALKNGSVEKTVIYPALIIIGVICAYFLYAGFALSINPWHLVQQFVTQTVEQNISIYGQLPLDKEDIDLIKNNKLIFINLFTGIFPALAIIGSVAIVWINVLMAKDMLRRAEFFLPRLDKLSRWSAPGFIIWIFIAAGGLLLLPVEQIRFLSLNILIVTCFIYLLQGFAIISSLFQNKNVPIFFRYLFYFLIAVQQFIMIPIVVAGLVDIWVDFRRFFQKDQTSS
jgi:uncharacterized protein YybS (DUF2232 family)